MTSLPRATAILALLLPIGALPATAQPEFAKRAFQLQYRQALLRYASGDLEGALEDLVGAESQAVGEATDVEIERMWKAKLEIIRDLLSAAPDSLLPVTLLHERAYLVYRDQRQMRLAVHSRTMAVELIEFYAHRVEGDEAKYIASGMLASLGGHLQEGYMAGTGVSLYNQALELNPVNETALLNLGALYEKNGLYDRALPYFDRLVRTFPGNAEGRLRLAINQARARLDREAQANLREILAGEAPEWVLSLAFQELAKTLAAEGRLQDAVRVLERGLERLPGDPILAIQHAHAFEQHRGYAPGDLAEVLDAAAQRSAGPSPRYQYSQMPQEALEALRQQLLERNSQQLTTLNRALSYSNAIELGS